MERNESRADRMIRAVLGVIFIIGGVALTGPLSVVLFVLSAVMLFTAGTGFCLLYKLFGINTCKAAKECE